jgi:uncharacterized membrane protein
MSPALVVGLTIILVSFILVGLFYLMYHTFHGNLPKMMKGIIAIFLLVGVLLAITGIIF